MKSRYKYASTNETGELTLKVNNYSLSSKESFKRIVEACFNKYFSASFKPDSSDNIRAFPEWRKVVGVNPTLATKIINNLKTNNNMKCPTCGKELGTESFISSDECSIKEHGECFECSLWRERLSLLSNPDVAIIDGTMYTIGDENDSSPFRGFGGDKFVINFKDGRQVTTTNLWCGGHISEHWKPQFPDNANFDWQWKKISECNYLVPKENEEIPDSLIAQAETNIGM